MSRLISNNEQSAFSVQLIKSEFCFNRKSSHSSSEIFKIFEINLEFLWFFKPFLTLLQDLLLLLYNISHQMTAHSGDLKCNQLKQDELGSAPSLPVKPLRFQIKQLEKLVAGNDHIYRMVNQTKPLYLTNQNSAYFCVNQILM